MKAHTAQKQSALTSKQNKLTTALNSIEAMCSSDESTNSLESDQEDYYLDNNDDSQRF